MSKIKQAWLSFINAFKKIGTGPEADRQFRKKIVIYILIAIVVIIVGAIITFGIGLYKYQWQNKPAKWAEEIIPYPAAVGGMGWIDLADYRDQLSIIDHFYQKTKQKPAKGYQVQLLEQMIDQKIVEKEAKKANLSVSAKEIDDQYQQIILEQGSEQQVKKILSDLWGMSSDQFKDLIKQQLIRTKLKDVIPIQVKVRHILYKVVKGTDTAGKKVIKKKAKLEMSKIQKSNLNFNSQAKKYSEDAATKNKGGNLGWLAHDQANLGDDCEAKLFSTAVDQMALCKSKYGYHILKIEDKKGKVDKTFEEWLTEKKQKTWIWRVLKVD